MVVLLALAVFLLLASARRMKRAFAVAPLVVLISFIPSIGQAPPEPISALAPVEIVLDGHQELVGVVVTVDGTLYVSDREAGLVLRRAPAGLPAVAAQNLDHPAGLALDGDGRLLIVEEGAGRILRLEPSGALTVLATGIKKPRWIAAATDDDLLYFSAKRLRSSDEDEDGEADQILRLAPGQSLTVAATGLRHLEGLVRVPGALVVATRGLKPGAELPGTLLHYPVLADGGLSTPLALVNTGLKEPVGLAQDRLGALYATAKELVIGGHTFKRAIGKIHTDAHLSRFAEALEDPRGLALGPDGSLYVADGEAGRVVRFRALPAPTLNAVPAFTNQSLFPLRGSTDPQARVDALVNNAPNVVTATADAAGAFFVLVSLALNVQNTLKVFTTPHGGDGLTSAPAEAALLHDNIPPSLGFLQPPGGVFVRQTITVQAQATDGGSGVASLVLSADAQALTATLSPTPPAPSITTTATWNTAAVHDGTHTLTATATDRAGNNASATGSVIVDNTPPDTQITGGPAAQISTTTVTFTFTGIDNLTPVTNLQFAWRLDGGVFSAFSPATSATLTNLTAGSHTFEVKARDLAGNENPTPAQRLFTVSALTVHITTPTAGATVLAGSLLVHGMVDAGGTEVGVVVNGVPAAVQGTTFAALVPVDSNTTILTAVATTTAGTSASHSVALAVSGTQTITLLASPQTGVAPLTVSFSLASSSAPATIAMDFDGNGTVDFTRPKLDGQTFTYTQPGLYFPIVTITDAQGNRFMATTLVQVYDQLALDVSLQAKWITMRDSLSRGDIEGTLQFIAMDSRDEFRADFTALTAFLPTFASALENIRLVSVRNARIEYELLSVENGATFSYYVEFIRDTDGIWRIAFF
jgi:PKD repeat protein/sugar lactone lactonase YvrE